MENPHEGHRERLKARFAKTEGADFEDHELLELLLFYALPRKDTNALAHDLLKRFGSLKGVFGTGMGELCAVSEIGRNTAVLIKVCSVMARRFYADKTNRPVLATVGDAAEYVSGILYGLPAEEFHIFCLDIGLKLIGHAKINAGDAGKVTVNKRDVVKTALNMNAAYVILAHNHPGGTPRPSIADIDLTKQLTSLLGAVGIKVCDHIITSDSEFYSFMKHAAFCVENAETLLIADQYGM